MSRDELMRDTERMEQVCIRLGGQTDIWQSRCIYWIAVAVMHLLQDAITRKEASE